MRHILIATDGSDGADRAADVAITLARAFQSTLSIVYVQERLSADEIEELAHVEKKVPDALEALSIEILQNVEGKAKAAGVADIRTHSCFGEPSETIIETARRERADAVVMGRRGRGRLAGLFLGSASQKVSTVAACIVIIVP